VDIEYYKSEDLFTPSLIVQVRKAVLQSVFMEILVQMPQVTI